MQNDASAEMCNYCTGCSSKLPFLCIHWTFFGKDDDVMLILPFFVLRLEALHNTYLWSRGVKWSHFFQKLIFNFLGSKNDLKLIFVLIIFSP